jgi:hypothetical protein
MAAVHHFKRYWNETTVIDTTDSWGNSVYYFETDEAFFPIR